MRIQVSDIASFWKEEMLLLLLLQRDHLSDPRNSIGIVLKYDFGVIKCDLG